MALPAGVQTVQLVVGDTVDVSGAVAPSQFTLRADFGGPGFITWAATRQSMNTLLAEQGAPCIIEVACVDQPGWVDPTGAAFTDWALVGERVTRRSGRILVETKRFQLVAGQTVVHWEDIDSGLVGVPHTAVIPAVTSVNGMTGDVYVASGGGGSSAEVHDFTDSALWSMPHALGRRPSVTIFTSAGELVETDVFASSTVVTATFPEPTSGSAVLT